MTSYSFSKRSFKSLHWKYNPESFSATKSWSLTQKITGCPSFEKRSPLAWFAFIFNASSWRGCWKKPFPTESSTWAQDAVICFSVGQEVAVLLTAGQPSPRNAQQWNYHPSPGQTYPAELLHVPGTDRCPPLAVEGSGCCFSGLRHKRCIFLTLHQMLALCSTQNHPANLCANCHARNTDFPALPSIFLVLSKSIPVLRI